MKKLLIIALSLLTALLFTEVAVRYIIGYPAYGLDYKVHYRKGNAYWTNVWQPYSGYWNVEGGNKVFRRNNAGLPGKDVNQDSDMKIAVLGSSFMEAYQINPQLIAVSQFSNLLSAQGVNASIYNLGYSGHDPYDSWFRIALYEQHHSFDKVMLVLESDYAMSLSKYAGKLNFETDSAFGKINKDPVSKIVSEMRNKSAFIYLVSKGFTRSGNVTDDNPVIRSSARVMNFTQELADCIIQYNIKYGDRFALVTITEESDFNDKLAVFCYQNKVNHHIEPILRPRLMFKGAGHLNEAGNLELGRVLHRAYNQFWGKGRSKSTG